MNNEITDFVFEFGIKTILFPHKTTEDNKNDERE